MSGETLWQRLACGVWRVRQRPDWAHYAGVGWVDRIMKMAVTDHFHSKQGRSTGRLVLEDRGKRLAVYLKRHYQLPRWMGFLAALWPNGSWSPALQEWEHLEWARAQGLPVPDTVAAGEYIGPWGRLQSFLAVEELTDMWSLNEAIPAAAAVLPQREFAYWKRTLLAELARLTRSLHDRRWFHKDLYLCHFFVRKEDTRTVPPWPGRVHLIDLHRLAHHPWMWRIWQVKDLAQLLYSSEIPGVTFRDRLQFWRFYLGAGHRHLGSQLLRSFIVFKWRRYQHHNIKRPLSDEW